MVFAIFCSRCHCSILIDIASVEYTFEADQFIYLRAPPFWYCNVRAQPSTSTCPRAFISNVTARRVAEHQTCYCKEDFLLGRDGQLNLTLPTRWLTSCCDLFCSKSWDWIRRSWRTCMSLKNSVWRNTFGKRKTSSSLRATSALRLLRKGEPSFGKYGATLLTCVYTWEFFSLMTNGRSVKFSK